MRIFTISLILLFLSCSSNKANLVYTDGDIISIIGVMSLVGSEPFTKPVIKTDKRTMVFLPENYKIDKNDLFNKKIIATGKITVKERKSADHKYTVYEYHIEPSDFKLYP